MSSALAMVLMVGMLRVAGVSAPDGKDVQAKTIPQDSRWIERRGSVWEFRKREELQTTNGRTGKKDFPSRYVVRPMANPPQIDIITIDGTALGIYRLKGDRLEICWACPGAERPTKLPDDCPADVTSCRAYAEWKAKQKGDMLTADEAAMLGLFAGLYELDVACRDGLDLPPELDR